MALGRAVASAGRLAQVAGAGPATRAVVAETRPARGFVAAGRTPARTTSGGPVVSGAPGGRATGVAVSSRPGTAVRSIPGLWSYRPATRRGRRATAVDATARALVTWSSWARSPCPARGPDIVLRVCGGTTSSGGSVAPVRPVGVVGAVGIIASARPFRPTRTRRMRRSAARHVRSPASAGAIRFAGSRITRGTAALGSGRRTLAASG